MHFKLKVLSFILSLSLVGITTTPPNRHSNYLAATTHLKPSNEGISRREALKIIGISGLSFLLPSWLTGCSDSKRRPPISPAPAIPTPKLSIEEHADWLISQISAATQAIQSSGTPRTNLIGMIKSFEATNNSFVHVYNQAMAVIALLVAESKFPGKGYQQAAATILTTLQNNQNLDGSFSTCFHLTDPAQDLLEKETGAIAFVGLAINLYTLKTADPQFIPMGEQIADYLVLKAISRPSFPGRAVENSNQLALSGEENLAVFAFLNEFSNITMDPMKIITYQSMAIDIRLFLENLWDNSEERFKQGRNSSGTVSGTYSILDPGYAADMQTSSLLSLGIQSSNGLFDFTRSLNPTAPNGIKLTLETTNSVEPNGIAFTLATKGANPQNWDAAQTNRYANALVEATRKDTSLSTTFTPEANQQLIQAEALSIMSSPGTIGTNTPTNVSGTHGGVILVLTQRGQFITPQLGPAVEATAEAIVSKAEVNFYRASEAVTQFSSLDKQLIQIALDALSKTTTEERLRDYKLLLTEPLGAYQEGRVRINPEHLSQVWALFRRAFPLPALFKNVAETYHDFILGVIHHEAIVHPYLSDKFLQLHQKGTLSQKVQNFLYQAFLVNPLKDLLDLFQQRFNTHIGNLDSDRELIEEFFAQLISYVAYPKGSSFKFFLADKKVQKVLKELPDIKTLAEAGFLKLQPGEVKLFQSIVRKDIFNHNDQFDSIRSLVELVIVEFPTLLPNFLYKVRDSSLEERRARVLQQLAEFRDRIVFENEEKIFKFVEPVPVEQAL